MSSPESNQVTPFSMALYSLAFIFAVVAAGETISGEIPAAIVAGIGALALGTEAYVTKK